MKKKKQHSNDTALFIRQQSDSISTELDKAITEGYVHPFVFNDGLLYCLPEIQTGYPIGTVHKQPRPCLVTRTIVYRIETPGGLKGHAVLDFDQDEEAIDPTNTTIF